MSPYRILLRINISAVHYFYVLFNSENEWTEDAVIQFEELTKSGMWYKLHAVVESTLNFKGTTNPIPSVTLIDSSNNVGIIFSKSVTIRRILIKIY